MTKIAILGAAGPVLSYSVFTEENVITRSVRVKNEGSEALKVEKMAANASSHLYQGARGVLSVGFHTPPMQRRAVRGSSLRREIGRASCRERV